jgi:hypothetical protein
MPDLDIGAATADDFAPRRNEEFRLSAPAGQVILTLTEVRRLGEAQRPGGAFSLLFVVQGGSALPQATYQIDHPALGSMDMFIVPIGPMPGGAGYEAVFT